MKREKQKRNKIIIALIGVLILMTVGYAAYNTNLNITGTSNISNSWDIEITNISDPVITGSAKHVAKEITNNNQSASMEADLYEIGDSATYTVTIENKGSVDAVLDSISKDTSDSNENIDITFKNYTKGQRLSAGDTMDIKVKIAYPSSTAFNTNNINNNIKLMSTNTLATGEVRITFNFVQAEGYEGSEDFPIPDTYLVEYDCTTNGGKDCSEYNEYLKEGESVNLSHIGTTKTGYEFVGWNTDSNATEGLGSLSVTSETIDENNKIVLYAIYEANLQAPTFEEKVGDPTVVTITYPKGCTSPYTCQYKIDDGEFVTANTNTVDVEYSKSGTLVAKTSDGTNELNSSYTVTFVGGTGADYLTTLALTDSTLITDDYGNIRYSGKNVNNYVCMDSTEATCSDTNLYRIIGVFNNIKTTSEGTGETRIKLIKATNNGNNYWNNSTNYNNWTEASLKNTLNSSSFAQYSSSLIEDAVWNIGGRANSSATSSQFYTDEIGTTVFNGRPTTWTGKVALMYPSDYGYASSSCYSTKNLGGGSPDYRDSDCTGSNWLYLGSNEWLLTPTSSNSNYAFYVNSTGDVINFYVYSAFLAVRPTVYLKSDVLLVTDGRDGSSESPYLLTETNSPKTNTKLSLSTTNTKNSITATADTNLENVNKYEFKIDNGNWINNSSNNTYTFEGLSNNTEYEVTARIIDSEGNQITNTKTVKTHFTDAPTFTETIGEDSTIITITYPDGCSEYTCKYIKDDDAEVEVTQSMLRNNSIDIEFTSPGTLTAIITDGTNIVSGTYTVTVPLVSGTDTYEYKNEAREFTAPAAGDYLLEVWGAQGGYRSDSTKGGKGGYSKGTLTLKKGDKLYIYTGGSGNTGGTSGGFNGGGARTNYNGGGGASDIRINEDSLYARVIVAGGGGSDGATSKIGMYGGGETGGSTTENYGSGGFGGTQTGVSNSSWYVATHSTSTTTQAGAYASFGYGGNGITYSSGYGGAGGGGWYGGSGSYPDGSGDDDRGGAGGSGYVYTEDTATNCPTGCLLNESYYLKDAETKAGNTSFTSPTGEDETGHSGDGYARISYEIKSDPKLSLSATSTPNTITATASTTIENVTKYEFKIGNNDWVDNNTSNTYTFNNLKSGTNYKIQVRATNKDGKVVAETTKQTFPTPTFSSKDTETEEIVTIKFSDKCNSDYTCSYKKNDEEWATVTDSSAQVTFTEVGTLIAKMTDGTNTTTSTYNITLEKIEFNSVTTTSTTNSITVVAKATADSGISKYEYSLDGEEYEEGSIDTENNNSTYTFTNLKQNEIYSISVKVTSNNGKQIIKQLGKTSLLDTVDIVTEGDGLYQDETETDRYIYKGTNPNNYITFNGEEAGWRIYSVESDGTYKIVKKDLLSNMRIFDTANARPTSSNSYCKYSSSSGCNAWSAITNLVGSPPSFVNGSVSGTVSKDSEMLTYLNSDTNGNYYYSLTSTAKNQIVSHDWNVGPAGTNDDTYTLAQLVSSDYEGKYKWNGKIGLLTKSEYMRTSSNNNCVTASYWYNQRNMISNACKSSHYLNSSDSWYLLSPYSGDSSAILSVYYGGYLINGVTYANSGVRPVLYLSSNMNLKGSGTQEEPYEISDAGITTPTLETPTFTETETSTGKTITIDYHKECGSNGITCTYIKDGVTTNNLTGSTQTVDYTDGGTLVATISDGTNTVNTSSYTVEIPKIATNYITNLANTDNTLITDDYGNIRYSGKNVNNYVCMDSTENTCSDANLYRIIGVFNNIKTTENGTAETRIKLIKATNNENAAWNNSNGSYSTNNWNSASLKNTLNSSSFAQYTNTLIDSAVWNIGGSNTNAVKSKNMYNYERGTSTCATTGNCSGQSIPTTWTGKVALMYPSDYGYASSSCYSTKNLGGGSPDYGDSDCIESNWLFGNQSDGTQYDEWFLTPTSSNSIFVFSLSNGRVYHNNNTVNGYLLAVRPTLYLKSSVNIIVSENHDGSLSKPYLLSE